MDLHVTDAITIPASEIQLSAIRAGGPGGQHVNKVSSAIHLRFDVQASSLPAELRERLLQSGDGRISSEGVVVIKAAQHRSQEKNRREALSRLADLVRSATRTQKKRIATRPSRAAKRKRVDDKKKRGAIKKLRSDTSY